jgi:hypothetical protein
MIMGESRRRRQMGLPPRQVQVRVPISELKDRVCPKCQGMLFIQMMALKELLVGFGCVACGTVISLRPEPEKVLGEEPAEGQEKKESGIVLATH